MTEIQLGYGQRSLEFSFDDNRYKVLSGNLDDAQPLSDVEIGEALSAPIQSPQLEDLFSTDDSVLIVVSDATSNRKCANSELARAPADSVGRVTRCSHNYLCHRNTSGSYAGREG
jgi:nickel-dependent lactate racemase